MSIILQQFGLDQLSTEEHLTLISEIWDSLPATVDNVSDSHKEELDRRIAAADANPNERRDWNELKLEMRSKH